MSAETVTWAWTASRSSYGLGAIDASEATECASLGVGSAGAALATGGSPEQPVARDARPTLASFVPWSNAVNPEGPRVFASDSPEVTDRDSRTAA